MLRDISIEEALEIRQDTVILDVRSPGEYKTATIPGAVNIPLLDNVERSLVGTCYKNKGPQAARYLAMEIVTPKLPALIHAVRKVAGGKPVVLFCWRGGERSFFMASILSFMGFKVYRVTGGFKAHRRYVRSYLARESVPLKAVVLHGLTGVGKTEVLHLLAEKKMPVLDLEGLACHRGSVFGKIGMPPSPSQKMFEALIVNTLKNMEKHGIFVVECESRRLGNLFVPESVMNSMKNGYNVLLYAPLRTRVERIKKIYTAGNGNIKVGIQSAVERLTKYLGRKKVAELKEQIERDNIEEVIEFLLTRYYDPLYGFPDEPSEVYDYCINTANLQEAVEKLQVFLSSLPEFSLSR